MCLAVPGKIVSVSGDTAVDSLSRTGRVSFGGVVKEVSLAYVPEADLGDYVIVHVGFAISVVDEEEAARSLEYAREIGALSELSELEAVGG
jgi:hydrogenase expression/formation protein HypC